MDPLTSSRPEEDLDLPHPPTGGTPAEHLPAVAGLQVLDSQQAAQLLRCSAKTVEDHCRRGDLPGLKFGDGWIIPAAALIQRLHELALAQAAERRRGREHGNEIVALALKNSSRTRREPPRLPSVG